MNWEYAPFIALAVVLVIIYLVHRRNTGLRREHLASVPSFKPKYQLDAVSHLVAFDIQGRNVAFAHTSGVRVVSFDALVDVTWHWIEKNGVKTSNVLTFQLDEISAPLVKVRCNTADQAEQWLAKITAILKAARERE